jgi:Phosphate-selective porin O and P
MHSVYAGRAGRCSPWLAAGLLALSGLATTAPARAGDVTINGRIYADLTNFDNQDDATGAKSADTGYGTDVKRFYVQIGYKLDDIWSAHFTSDVGDKGTKRYDVFVKHAYLEAKLSDQVTFRLGSTDLPWVPFAEGAYGYRYLENEIVDRLKFGTSADWGVHFRGKSGMVEYAASAVNGRGYSDPTRSKGADFEGRVSFAPVKGLTIGVGGYSGKLGQDVEGAQTFHTASRADALIAYKSDKFQLGGEYFSADNWTTVTNQAKDSADGFSAWVAVPVGEKVEVFGRFDSAKPSKDRNPDLKDTYYNAGVQFSPGKGLNLALAYKHEKVDSGLGGKINGIGSSTPSSTGTANEIGLWTQLRW